MKTCRMIRPETKEVCGGTLKHVLTFKDDQQEPACDDCMIRFKHVAPPGTIKKIEPLK